VYVYPQCHENARKLLKRSLSYSEVLAIQNVHLANGPIWIPALVLQRYSYLQKHQQTKENAKMGSPLDYWHIPHIIL